MRDLASADVAEALHREAGDGAAAHLAPGGGRHLRGARLSPPPPPGAHDALRPKISAAMHQRYGGGQSSII